MVILVLFIDVVQYRFYGDIVIPVREPVQARVKGVRILVVVGIAVIKDFTRFLGELFLKLYHFLDHVGEMGFGLFGLPKRVLPLTKVKEWYVFRSGPLPHESPQHINIFFRVGSIFNFFNFIVFLKFGESLRQLSIFVNFGKIRAYVKDQIENSLVGALAREM